MYFIQVVCIIRIQTLSYTSISICAVFNLTVFHELHSVPSQFQVKLLVLTCKIYINTYQSMYLLQ